MTGGWDLGYDGKGYLGWGGGFAAEGHVFEADVVAPYHFGDGYVIQPESSTRFLKAEIGAKIEAGRKSEYGVGAKGAAYVLGVERGVLFGEKEEGGVRSAVGGYFAGIGASFDAIFKLKFDIKKPRLSSIIPKLKGKFIKFWGAGGSFEILDAEEI